MGSPAAKARLRRGVALQSFKSSFSDKGFKIVLRRRNKFRTSHHNAQFQISIECVVREIGAGNQNNIVDDRDFCVELPWTTCLISFPLFHRPMVDLCGADKRRRKGLQRVVAKLAFRRFFKFENQSNSCPGFCSFPESSGQSFDLRRSEGNQQNVTLKRRDKGNVAGAIAPAAAAQLGAADVPIPVNLAGVYDQSFQLAGPLPASRSDISLASPFA